jgi:hypothetical protein
MLRGGRELFHKGMGRDPGSRDTAVTFQKDVVNMNKRHKPNRRTMRRAKKFKGKVRNVMLSEQPTNVYKTFFAQTATALAGAQTVAVIPGCYSMAGSAAWDDLYSISRGGTYATPINAFAAGTVTGAMPKKLFIKNAIEEFDISNTGATACVVELFECVCRSNWMNTGLNPFVNIQTGAELIPFFSIVPAAQTALNQGVQYVTPYDSNLFCRYFKILSQKRIYLNAGAATDVVKHVRGATWDPAMYADQSATAAKTCWPGHTRFWIMIGTGSPVVASVSSAQFSASSLSYTVQRTYNYKQLSMQVPMQGTS